MSSFEGEKMETQYNALSYRTDWFFNDNKVAKKMDENGYRNRNIDTK